MPAAPRLLRQQSRLVIRIRALLIAVSLGVLWLSSSAHGLRSLRPAFLLLAALFLINLGYLLLASRLVRLRLFLAVTLFLDVGFIAWIVYLTGGAASPLSHLHFVVILAAAICHGSRLGVALASLATIGNASASGIHYYAFLLRFQPPGGILGPDNAISYEPRTLIFLLCSQAMAYHLVAILAGRLAGGAHRERFLREGILSNLQEGIVTTDLSGRLAFLNRTALTLLGWTGPTEEILGQPWSLLTPAASPLSDLLSSSVPSRQECSLISSSEVSLPVAAASSWLCDERGRRRGMLLVLSDLRQRKRAEEAERQLALLAASRTAAAGIAHEIRNPIASLRGAAQELAAALPLGPGDRRLFDLILRESDRIDQIVHEFLDFTRESPLCPRLLDLPGILSEIHLLLRQREEAGAAAIAIECPQALRVQADYEQLKRALLNLGINALEALPPAGGRVVFRAWPAAPPPDGRAFPPFPDGPPARGVIIECQDNGHGISPEHRPRLFEPFFTTKTRGTGLGLALLRNIMARHHGKIDCRPSPGQGTTFRLWFPDPDPNSENTPAPQE